MSVADLMTNCAGVPDVRFSQIIGEANLRRGMYANGSNCKTNKQDCEAQGLGYTYSDTHYGIGQCYFPCPDAYTISADDPTQCEPRPLLTKVSIYYEIMTNAVNDCARLIPAYRDAVAEANNDPSQVAFPSNSGCVNPFDPPVPPPAEDGNYDPTPADGDPLKPADAPPQTDPNGTSGEAGEVSGGTANDGEPFIPTVPDGTKQEPYVPPVPASYQEIDESDPSGMSKTLPRDRILITAEEIDQLPKVNDFGTMTEGDLALRLQAHPTFLDVNPSYLKDFQTLVPTFVYECSITQAEFDLLPDNIKCSLCGNYDDYVYGNPQNIAYMRGYAPTITLTRNAPSTKPTFVGCPQDVKKVACESKTGYGGIACSYSGGCDGDCVCPQPPSTSGSGGSSRSGGVLGEMDTTTMLLLGGGFVAVSIFLLR
jgi:hypothetical protein